MKHSGINNTMKLMLISIVIGAVVGDSSYNPRGWQPSGPSFSSHDNRYRSNRYNNAPALSYGSPPDTYSYPSTTIAPSINDVKRATSTTTMTTTTTTTNSQPTTPRSREPTTASNIEDEDAQINPALAIANSFAFNRPVYIYTGFPFHPSFAFVQ